MLKKTINQSLSIIVLCYWKSNFFYFIISKVLFLTKCYPNKKLKRIKEVLIDFEIVKIKNDFNLNSFSNVSQINHLTVLSILKNCRYFLFINFNVGRLDKFYSCTVFKTKVIKNKSIF